jgi:head-tail adaptor
MATKARLAARSISFMPAGLLRERIVFEQRSTQQDGAGNYVDEWEPNPAVPARIQYLKAGEEVMGQRLSGTQPVIITVRSSGFTRSVTSDWRARDARSGKTFNLAAPRPGEKRDYIDFLATAGGADG